MNLGQPGFVPTGRKQLANPRGWGFNSSNSARGQSGRASRSRKACAPGPRDLLCPAGRAPRGARPKVAALLSILSGSGPRWNHPHSENWGQQRGQSLTLGCAYPQEMLGGFLQVLTQLLSFH